MPIMSYLYRLLNNLCPLCFMLHCIAKWLFFLAVLVTSEWVQLECSSIWIIPVCYEIPGWCKFLYHLHALALRHKYIFIVDKLNRLNKKTNEHILKQTKVEEVIPFLVLFSETANVVSEVIGKHFFNNKLNMNNKYLNN